ncbi:hypothetical protein CEUSTIGMA_g4564.t1 [Chlamydomonas eustigma]|uniref:guanylate kinase n=1 Tax=Chlamydomonas eustigma TaxID=1157962 RepID=A0A250X222_9CHLO|nr:hypothetical protein CEUSTIGMA_g4564.t1 [Chlamydomonas eustigma]|eukprot:GAX77118.1 hypothetical protein CEUSTIGMA_g4564.t1 [Chlamydomonas eustigma]
MRKLLAPSLGASRRAVVPFRQLSDKTAQRHFNIISVLHSPSSSSTAPPLHPEAEGAVRNPSWCSLSLNSHGGPLYLEHEKDSCITEIEQTLGPLDNNPIVPAPKPVVVIISGPSGVGKDSVLQRLKEKREDLYFVVTATSRPMRPKEVEGRDYFFVSKEKFERWIAEGQLLEHAMVYGDYKGIPRQQVDQAVAAGTDVLLRIDVQGAATVKKLIPEAVSIFIAAESQAKLVERLAARKTESIDKMLVRVQTAQKEMEKMRSFDYAVVNKEGCLDQCADAIAAIIDAEKAKIERNFSTHSNLV